LLFNFAQVWSAFAEQEISFVKHHLSKDNLLKF
jgi:hypothetical protein